MAEYRSPAIKDFEWQQACDDRALSPAGGEAKGYRYLIDGTGSGDFAGEDNKIATAKQANPSQASHWYFDSPIEGMMVYVKDEDKDYLYITSWNIYKDLTDKELDVIRNNDNIMLNAFRVAINGSLSQFNMVDGIIDEYEDESGIDTGASTNEDYDATDDYYSPSIGTSMTLISDSFTAESQPDSARIVLLEEDVDSITLNTDIKAYVSRDGGTTYTQVTLVDEGNYDSSKRILAASIDISGQPSGTGMRYKIESLNNKDLKLHATGISWS